MSKVNFFFKKDIVKELLTFLVEADDDIISKVTQRACQIIEVHSPSRRWQVDKITRVLTLAGKHVKDSSISTFLQLIAATPQLQAYSITKLFNALKENKFQDALVRVALWCVGEFGELVSNGEAKVEQDAILDIVDDLVSQPEAGSIKCYSLNCLVKLATKFSQQKLQRILSIIQQLQRDKSADVQQRAVEYGRILESSRLSAEQKRAIFDSMPVAKISMSIFHSKPVDEGGQVPEPATEGNAHIAKEIEGNAENLLDFDDIELESTPVGGGSIVGGNTNQIQQNQFINQGLSNKDIRSPLQKQNQTQQNPLDNLLNMVLGSGTKITTNIPETAQATDGSPTNPANLLEMDLIGADADLGGFAAQNPSHGSKPISEQPHSQHMGSEAPTEDLKGMDLLGMSPIGDLMAVQQPELHKAESVPPGHTQNVFGGDIGGSMQDEAQDFEFGDFEMPKSEEMILTALGDENLELLFKCVKENQKTKIDSFVRNKSGFDITNYEIKIAPAKHVKLNLLPLSSKTAKANSEHEITQVSFFLIKR